MRFRILGVGFLLAASAAAAVSGCAGGAGSRAAGSATAPVTDAGSAVIDTHMPGPPNPITSAQDAISRAVDVTADVVSVTSSRATLTTFAAIIASGRMNAPTPGYPAAHQVWDVGLQGVIKHAGNAATYTYDWEIALFDPASGGALGASAGDGPLPGI